MEARRTYRFQSNSSDSINEEEINIYLKVMKTVPLRVKRSGTIRDLKALVRQKEGVSENLQEVFFSGSRLMDGQKLVDCGIQKDSILHLIVQNVVGMKIFIKIPSQLETFVVEGRTRDTIQNIKSMIQTKEGIQSNRYSLIYDGIVLEDDMTLSSLNLQSEPTFYLVFNPKDVLSLSVKAQTGEVVKLKVKVLFTVGDVKAIVGSMIGVPVSDQNLIYAGKQLEDCKTLASYDIKEESILEMLPPLIQIFVKTWSGKTITLDVQQCDTIKDVKDKIFNKLRIRKMPTHFQSLLYTGKRLEEDQDLASYNIQKHSTLHMVLSPSARVVKMPLSDIGESVPNDTTISEVKAMIQNKMRDPVKEVYFCEVALRDEKSLAYYKIDKDATLVVAF